jgi:hypothetical protein
MKSTVGIVIASAGVVALITLTPNPSSASTYNWQGTCTLGCTGITTGVLTLADDASPFNFTVSNFVSFQFTSSSGTFFLDNTSPFATSREGQRSPRSDRAALVGRL